MQCQHLLSRPLCTSPNAYSISTALRSALLSTTTYVRPDEPQDSASTAPVDKDGERPGLWRRSPHWWKTPQEVKSGYKIKTFKFQGDKLQRHRGSRYVARKDPLSWQGHMRSLAADAGRFSNMTVRVSDTTTINERRAALEYHASYIKTPASLGDQRLPIPWALDAAQFSGNTGAQILQQEVDRFVEYIQPTALERVAREAVKAELMKQIANLAAEEVKCEMFGSERIGLAIATSDIDIRVAYDIEDGQARYEHTVKRMETLEQRMIDGGKYILVTARYGTYPIINAQHKETGIDVQVVAQSDTSAQQAVTALYLNEIPHLRSLYMLLRTALGVRNLVDVFTGGTGSYGLFIMLVASLKRGSTNPPGTLQEHLFRFLDFYADLDRNKYGVSVSPPKLFKKHDPWEVPTKDFVDAARRREDLVRAGQWAMSQRRLYQPYLLCLQDPANPVNDLGRKSNAIKHVIATLDGLRTELRADMEQAGEAAAQGRLWKGESVLLSLVGRCHELNLERRRRVENYGLKVMEARSRASEKERVANIPNFAAVAVQ